MTTIGIPQILRKKLKGSTIEPHAITTFEQCKSFVGNLTQGLPLFPEYTDHSIHHFQRVLNAAEQLITPESRKKFTAEDSAVLTAAVMLHDAAMHLTEDSFLTLVSDSTRPSIDGFGDRPWADEWAEYMTEAARWDERQLTLVLADSTDSKETVDDLARYVAPLPEWGAPENWTKKHRKIAGEFIRRKHARLAHEFAILGAPGKDSSQRVSLVALESPYADIAGLVARSHNMRLRDTFAYLENKYYGRETCFKTHPIYLMALLRIADYLEVDPGRAPSSTIAVRNIRNSFSRREWEVHQSIRDVRADERDRESLFVVAEPPNAQIYLKLRELLDAIQQELDTTWAVLGEVFSGKSQLKCLALPIRRIRSNIDDLATFRETVPYVPKRFRFESAGFSLLQKLIEPLYGDHPEIGIRELLQNAIDAVRELDELNRRRSRPVPGDHETRVVVRLHETADGPRLDIEDSGIGMDESVLADYFFRVGASFRESDAWRRDFVEDKRPTVIRSGRFGIGVLACFLLGDSVEVVTRHESKSPDEALSFRAKLRSHSVEVCRDRRETCGTSIRVQLSRDTYARLKREDGIEWDWYRWPTPAVERIIDDNRNLRRLIRIPEPGSPLPTEWHRVAIDGYDEVLWTYGNAPSIVCNGINVGTAASSRGHTPHIHWEAEHRRLRFDLPVRVPSVSVTDRNGAFPVSLARTGLVAKAIPFSSELLADVTRDYIAFNMVFAPTSPLLLKQSPPLGHSCYYPGDEGDFSLSFSTACPWFFTREGSGVQHWAALRDTSIQRAKALVLLDYRDRFPAIPIDEGDGLFLFRTDGESRPLQAIPTSIAHLLCRRVSNTGPHVRFVTQYACASVFMSEEISQRWRGFWSGDIDLSGLEVFQDGKLTVWSTSQSMCEPSHLPDDVADGVANGRYLYAELTAPRVAECREDSFASTWREFVGGKIIPYERERRAAAFPKTYEELKTQIEAWHELLKSGTPAFRSRFRNLHDQSPV